MAAEREQPTLREKQNRAVNIRLSVVNGILATDTFTPEGALNLANLYLSYTGELLLYNEDATRRGVEQGESPIEEKIADRYFKERLETETPLDMAHFRGDYRPLKARLQQEGRDSIHLSETEEREDIFEMSVTNSMRAHGMSRKKAEEYIMSSVRHNRRFGERLLAMADVIPDEGDPLLPPPPAWEIEG